MALLRRNHRSQDLRAVTASVGVDAIPGDCSFRKMSVRSCSPAGR